MARTLPKLGDLIARFSLQSIDGKPPRAPRPADRYGIFRLDPTTGAAAGGGHEVAAVAARPLDAKRIDPARGVPPRHST